MADVMIFAPSPLLTVTLEDDADGSDLHVHAGGQGVWQARMLRIRDAGAESVVVSRAGQSTLLVEGDTAFAVQVPVMEEVDSRGAGDSFTAALASALVDGDSLRDAVGLGVAAGALNVTRHGLGTGDAEAIHRLGERVEVREIRGADAGQITLDELAARTEVEEIGRASCRERVWIPV